jgi:predicted amidohydrolase
MAELARDHQILIGSSLLERENERYYNTFTLFGLRGEMIGAYRKIHLFRLLDEPEWLNPGDRPIMVDFGYGKTGLSICYDVRFAELFRGYAYRGCKLVLIVAEWPEDRIDHWKKLIAARAIENQLFIAAVNKAGKSRGSILGGMSMIVDPMGRPICQAGSQEIMLTASIDLQEVNRVRKWMAVLEDSRPDVYSDWEEND